MKQDKSYFAYIITNKYNTVLYIGMTNNLERRIYEHKNGVNEGFSKDYRLHKLVYFEESNDVYEVIKREKQLKSWKRKWKLDLIKKENPSFNDLSQEWLYEDPESSSHRA
ncbi:GIY-YIG nuclease family protein [Patescibacteria group bacterium]